MNIGRNRQPSKQSTELKMTSMIDVVFLLLVFFLLTFKVLAPEGDFRVDMSQATVAANQVSAEIDRLPLRVELKADERGRLSSIRLGDRVLPDLHALRMHVRSMVTGDAGPTLGADEVELVCDENLRYEHTVDAITAFRGYVDRGRVVELIGKIRFVSGD